MHRVRLIHWKATEAEERAMLMRSVGYEVECETLSPVGVRALRENPPRAVVIDLSRAPSQGRDLALSLRKAKSTRRAPDWAGFRSGGLQGVLHRRDLVRTLLHTTRKMIGTSRAEALSLINLEDHYVRIRTYAQ